MHAPTGEIHQFADEDIKALKGFQNAASKQEFLQERKMIPLTEDQKNDLEPLPPLKRKNWMRNQSCICGSQKKFKKCCWSKFE